MDLYVQVGVILTMASMFALVAYYYADSAETGLAIRTALSEPSENYSLDSSITSPTFFVDARVFSQWVMNAKGQREVYLLYPPNIAPEAALYGMYMDSLEITQSDADPANRKLTVNPQVPRYTKNAFHVVDQAPKTVDYLALFSQTAKLYAKNKMITVYTFTDVESSKVIYVCYIK